jgi:ligand-binding sensor domain-containing protein
MVAQTLPCKNITINDGLPSNSIKCFFKDSRGLMWIGTEAGLCCYDGKSFKIYNQINGFKNNGVWAIAEDNQHNLWLSIYGSGLAKFDGNKFTYYDKKDGLVNNAIRKIYYSKKNDCLVLGTENGLSLFDGVTFQSYIQKTIINRFQISSINEYNGKVFVTVSHDNVYSIDFNYPIKTLKLKYEFKPEPTYSAFFAEGKYYSGMGKFSVRDIKTNNIQSFSSNIIWDYTKDDNNNIYATAWNVNSPSGGLYQYFNNQLTDITQKANITSTGLWCLYYDTSTQQLWVGSIDKGLFIVDLSNNLNFYQSSHYGLKKFEIQCLYNDSNNNLWMGGTDNIIIQRPDLKYEIINKQKLTNKILNYYKKRPELTKASNFKGTLNYHIKKKHFSCFNISEDKTHNIWVTTTIGYFCFDRNYDLKFVYFSDGGHLMINNTEELVYAEMYASTYIKKDKFDNTTGKVMSVDDVEVPKDINKIICHDNIIWFGTNSGLYKYENNIFCSLNSIGQFKDKDIIELKVNDKGELLIGTNSGIVYIAKWKNNKLNILQTYQPNKELFGTSIQFIEQSNGAYFVGTNKGINIIKNNHFVKLLNKSEGFTDIQFNDCTKDKNGNLSIATNNGIITINAKDCLQYNSIKKNAIKINSIKVNGVEQSNHSWGVFNSAQLTLKYHQNDIEILFESYNLFNADKNVYRYKVIGLSDTWSDFETNSKIQLLGLYDGKYTIVIQGKNIGTGEVFNSKQLQLFITPPFWKTWWFITCFIFLILFIVFITYKKRVQFIEKQEQAKGAFQKRLAETKMEALQSQMNPHFIFNAMNSIQNYIIDSNIDDALMYMGEFSKLIRQTLNNSSKQSVSLDDEIQYLETYIKLENLRLNQRVTYKFTVDRDIDLNEIMIPPMLIQPFVENVFIHAFDKNTNNPTLVITIQKKHNSLLFEIIDNGKGMNNEVLNNSKNSKGIILVKERIDLLQKRTIEPISISSIPNNGTKVTLRLQID